MGSLWNPFGGVYREAAPLFDWTLSLSDVFSNSLLGGAITAALGAGIGAWMAGYIAKSAKLRDEQLTELRSIDKAILLCEATLDLTAGLNRQFIQPLLQSYAFNKSVFEQAINSGSGLADIKIHHSKVSILEPPINELREIVLNEMTLSANGIRSILALSEGIKQLNIFIEIYGALVDRFINNKLPEGFYVHHFYFSLPVNGKKNSEYESSLVGLESYTKDVLFFTYKLAETLKERGLIVRERYLKLSGEKFLIRRINNAPGDDGYQIPSDDEYLPWLRGWDTETYVNPTSQKKWKIWPRRSS